MIRLMKTIKTFKNQFRKLVILLEVFDANRKEALFTIIVDNVTFTNNNVILLLNKTMHHSNPHSPLKPIT